MYAWRAKFGLITAIGESLERSFRQYAPDGVSFSTSKAFASRIQAKEVDYWSHLASVAELYRGYDISVLAFSGELGENVQDEDFDKKCQAVLEEASGIKTITSGMAAIDAFHALGIEKTAILSPYENDGNEAIKKYLECSGIQVVRTTGMDMSEFITDKLPYETADRDFLYKNAKAMGTDDIQALFLCGEGIDSMNTISFLERDLGIPVITSQQALFWAALRYCSVRAKIDNLGKLLTL